MTSNKQKAQHTPGPWTAITETPSYQHLRTQYEIVGGTKNYLLAQVEDGVGQGNSRANAFLIAAAPELLEALQAIVRAYFRGDPTPRQAKQAKGTYWERAINAIAKAEGDKEP